MQQVLTIFHYAQIIMRPRLRRLLVNPRPVSEAAGSPVVGDLLGLLVPGKKARGTRICKQSSVNILIGCASMTR